MRDNSVKCILISLLSLPFSGCDWFPSEAPDTFYPTKRVIENASGVPVNISIYVGGRDTEEGFYLGPGEVRIDEEVCEKRRGALRCDLILRRLRDSVVLTFDAERKIRYCSVGLSCYEGFDFKNIMTLPLFLENHEQNTGYLKTVEGDTSIFTFTITEEDYENADPI